MFYIQRSKPSGVGLIDLPPVDQYAVMLVIPPSTLKTTANFRCPLIAASQRNPLFASSLVTTLLAIVCWLEKQNKMNYAAYVGIISCN